VPDTYGPEREYVVDLVLGEWLGLDYRLVARDRRDVEIRSMDGDRHGALIVADVLLATPMDRWLTSDPLPRLPLPFLRKDEGRGRPRPLPILFGSAGQDGSGIEVIDDTTVLTVDVFGTALFGVTRYEELVDSTRDAHGRFPATASLAWQGGFLDRPIVDEYVELLSTTMHSLWPDLPTRSSTFQLRLTHDVDQPWSALGQPWGRIGKSLAADVFARRDLGLAARRLLAVADSRRGQVDADPLNRFDLFMDVAERFDQRATFFFLAAARPGDVDFRYRLSDPAFAPLLRRIADRGHEIGLHGSYASHGSARHIQEELATLVEACQAAGVRQPITSARQHFLRFEAPGTWRLLEATGITVDWSLGYADRAGFRAGTGRSFPVFDLRSRRRLGIREQPLLVMDTTLVEYEHLSIPQMERRIQLLVDACRNHGGDAVLLYHNNTLPGRAFERHYERLIGTLVRT
jgi:peptidoglycan/xylan/chitin deacetylase (PgdA/CDA1 family)